MSQVAFLYPKPLCMEVLLLPYVDIPEVTSPAHWAGLAGVLRHTRGTLELISTIHQVEYLKTRSSSNILIYMRAGIAERSIQHRMLDGVGPLSSQLGLTQCTLLLGEK